MIGSIIIGSIAAFVDWRRSRRRVQWRRIESERRSVERGSYQRGNQ